MWTSSADHPAPHSASIPPHDPRASLAYDTIIIGGGPAALSGTLTLGRARRRVLVVDDRRPRYQSGDRAHEVLGTDGSPALDLLGDGREELSQHGVEVVRATVSTVRDVVRGLAVQLSDGRVVHARSVVVASGVDVVEEPADDADSADGSRAGAPTADGGTQALDALPVTPDPRPRDAFLAELSLARVDTSVGSLLRVDDSGRTGHPRIWAAGTVVDPRLDPSASAGQGSMVAGSVNVALVQEETDNALFSGTSWPDVAEDGFWEDLYSRASRRWSGRPNQALVDMLEERVVLGPGTDSVRGTAVDIGCGEGADAIWLAQNGWETTGVDVSTTAIGRAEEDARKAEVPSERLCFSADGLRGLPEASRFDLVCTSYLHAPSQDLREHLLQDAARRVTEDGMLFVLSHVMPADDRSAPGRTVSAEQAIRELGLDPATWGVEHMRTYPSTVIDPSGRVVERADRAMLMHRA